MKEYAFFPGCITPNRYPGIEKATKKTLEEFGYKTVEMDGASCCPAPGVFGSFDLDTWLPIAARNISIAEEKGLDIYVTCNGCYASLQEANSLLREDPELKDEVNEILSEIGREYEGSSEVRHSIELFYDEIGLEEIEGKVVNPLDDLKVATHYGCHFLKPSEVRKHGSTERPSMLEDFVEALGASPVEYKERLACCGAGGAVRTRDLDTSLQLTKNKLESASKAGADCIVHPCAFCHLQFDRGQTEIKESFGTEYNLPVLFFTQALGLALGMDGKELGLELNKIPLTEKVQSYSTS